MTGNRELKRPRFARHPGGKFFNNWHQSGSVSQTSRHQIERERNHEIMFVGDPGSAGQFASNYFAAGERDNQPSSRK